MNFAELTIPAARLSPLEEPWAGPIAFVPLEDAGGVPLRLRLPPCPVIGVGNRDHPLAAALDAVIEPGFDQASITRTVLDCPQAAAALVQVLRVTRALPLADALTVESMAYAMLQASSEHRAWMSTRPLQPETPAGRVLVTRAGDCLDITLDRAEAGNAIDRAMRDGLTEALSLAALDPQLAQVRLGARGKAFSLGADLDEFGTTSDPATAHAIRTLTLPARAVIACADRLHVHIDGACVGAGLELAAFADRVTATPRSWFQLPELAMGIIPGAGGCVSLPRRIGPQRTALMVLSGKRIGARQALAWGLIDALVDDPATDERGGNVG
jgi:enoyl-CoA hydratase/carnithine racemase